jgi:hypothetical protein
MVQSSLRDNGISGINLPNQNARHCPAAVVSQLRYAGLSGVLLWSDCEHFMQRDGLALGLAHDENPTKGSIAQRLEQGTHKALLSNHAHAGRTAVVTGQNGESGIAETLFDTLWQTPKTPPKTHETEHSGCAPGLALVRLDGRWCRPLTCEHCGKTFYLRRDKHYRYCSKTCAGEAKAGRPLAGFYTPPAPKRARVRANGFVNARIKYGLMTRPKRCGQCGKACKPDAHHDDYHAKGAVMWLCRSCHMKRHRSLGMIHQGEGI